VETNTNAQVGAFTGNFCIGLFVIFLILKLVGVIDWSWWWVTAPLWMPWAIWLGILILVGIFILAITVIDNVTKTN
jgi:hypothetical protein